MSVPQSALSRHLSGMTSELALPGLELPREQGHMMTTLVLPPCLAPSLFVSSVLWGYSMSSSVKWGHTNHHLSRSSKPPCWLVCPHFTDEET